VYSSQEYAQFLTNNLPSGFPYFSSIKQYWYGYCAVYSITKNQYAMNWEDHLMLVVIGSSFSVEYAVKGIYENTIGWLSEWSSSYNQTQEDHYAAKVAQQYAEFIPYQPWFEFSFLGSLRGLWTQTDLYGPYMLRKWERKGILSIEYILKAGYSSLIAMGSHSTYGTVSQDTYVLMKNVPDAVFNTVFKNGARVKMVRKVGDHEYIAIIPREQAFTDIVPVLAENGVQFEDIAGNHSILVSAVTPPGWAYDLNEGTVLFKMNVLTQPYTKRIVIEIPVDQLSYLLVQLANSGATIEHIYDY
jgi:hypothetical protein